MEISNDLLTCIIRVNGFHSPIFTKKIFMKKTTLLFKSVLFGSVFSLIAMSSLAQKPVKNITSQISTNTTWSCDTVYFLKGIIYVTNGATITINPGTVIVGDTINKGSLVITKGAKIMAVGTPACPIVFTSSKKSGRRNRGDWGGVILLGKSSVNTPTGLANIEGITPNPNTEYGGGSTPDVHDNSGTMKYVRIEFAGVALAPNNEINGLTFGGVGDGTTIDYVQVSFSNDDSFEWFGGTVNCKHIIAFRGIDDDFDTDNGYSGKVQFAMGLRDPKVADISGSKGFESDNDASGSTNLPQTRAIFCNVTSTAGGDTTKNSLFTAGAHIRRNSHLMIYNSIIMGFPEGLLIDGSLTQGNVTADTLVNNNFITCTYAPKYVVTASPAGTASVINLLLSSNTYYVGNKKVKLVKPYALTTPDYHPKATSPALGAAEFDHAGLNDPFFDVVSYVGAFDKTDTWADTWTNFDPVFGDYYNTPCSCGTPKAETKAVTAEDKNSSVSVSPNPSNGVFKATINGFSNTVNIKVISLLTGNVSYTTKQSVVAGKSSTININAANLQAGLYSVEVSDGIKTSSTKLNVVK